MEIAHQKGMAVHAHVPLCRLQVEEKSNYMTTSQKPLSVAASLYMLLALLGMLAVTAEAQPTNNYFTNATPIVPTWNGSFQDTSGAFVVTRPAWCDYGT